MKHEHKHKHKHKHKHRHRHKHKPKHKHKHKHKHKPEPRPTPKLKLSHLTDLTGERQPEAMHPAEDKEHCLHRIPVDHVPLGEGIALCEPIVVDDFHLFEHGGFAGLAGA